MSPRIARRSLTLAAALAAVVAATQAQASPQRRGGSAVPPTPTNVTSTPEINSLRRAITALGETDRSYDGRREKAIEHIAAAIEHLEVPNARARTGAAVKSAAEKAIAKKAETTSASASEASVRKALKFLFTTHHSLTDSSATRGQLRADADVRIAIDELSKALNPPAAKGKARAVRTTPK